MNPSLFSRARSAVPRCTPRQHQPRSAAGAHARRHGGPVVQAGPQRFPHHDLAQQEILEPSVRRHRVELAFHQREPRRGTALLPQHNQFLAIAAVVRKGVIQPPPQPLRREVCAGGGLTNRLRRRKRIIDPVFDRLLHAAHRAAQQRRDRGPVQGKPGICKQRGGTRVQTLADEAFNHRAARRNRMNRSIGMSIHFSFWYSSRATFDGPAAPSVTPSRERCSRIVTPASEPLCSSGTTNSDPQKIGSRTSPPGPGTRKSCRTRSIRPTGSRPRTARTCTGSVSRPPGRARRACRLAGCMRAKPAGSSNGSSSYPRRRSERVTVSIRTGSVFGGLSVTGWGRSAACTPQYRLSERPARRAESTRASGWSMHTGRPRA